METIFITGATGQVGKVVYEQLIRPTSLKNIAKIVLGCRKPEALYKELSLNQLDGKVECRYFDFLDQSCFSPALAGCSRVFFMRPPALAKVEKQFKPFIEALKKASEKDLKQVVFLSVQGAEKMPWVPHAKIENLIKSYQIPAVFVRPAYFMQNLITEFGKEIVLNQEIVLPAKEAKFNWVDVQDIGAGIAHILLQQPKLSKQAYTFTGTQNLSFIEVSELLSNVLGKPITYKAVSPIRFIFRELKKGTPFAKAFVMLMLHFLPRFSDEPAISTDLANLLDGNLNAFIDFLEREKASFKVNY